jgi:hypothetical protein
MQADAVMDDGLVIHSSSWLDPYQNADHFKQFFMLYAYFLFGV